ncbi:serine/threonine-protein kinase Nek4-like isoform X3 [Ostrea edulis]|uniref:serine/threonine-protein kinase Nek4-like isoform X3 n=1 Tax=Ostrea edulis TaxID=37623 RepID=UPI0024AF16AD|nr:serine/threonine-protein kinase Nek4-like isoform X3 [Ostrea edulis]
MDKEEGKVYGDYRLEKLIGHGTYGYVYKARRNGKSTTTITSSEAFAVKLIHVKGANDRHWELVEREVEVSRKAEERKHPNIVSFKEHFKQDGVPCVVMEYCGGGTLYQKIRNLKREDKTIHEDEFISILQQIASGVEVLHDMNIIHRDLKTKNIMLTEDGTYKIADFGVAKIIEIAGMNTKGIGTPFYMCPEIIQGKPYDQKADIWSLGCTCFEIATGSYAFEGKSVQEINTVVKSGKIPETTKIQYSDEIKNLIVEMLSHDGASRPTIKGILHFIKDYKEKGARPKKKKSKKSRRQNASEDAISLPDSGVEDANSIPQRLDPRKASECKEFLERESAKLQATLVMEIRSHKAADIVSYIKSLQKKETPEREFKSVKCEWKKHILQLVNQDRARSDIIEGLSFVVTH